MAKRAEKRENTPNTSKRIKTHQNASKGTQETGNPRKWSSVTENALKWPQKGEKGTCPKGLLSVKMP